LTAAYTPDATSSPIYNTASGAGQVTVSNPSGSGFKITTTDISVAPGAASGNASTITLTPTNGFTGNVTLTAQIANSPAGATDTPTLSFGSTGLVTIQSASPQTATLTVSTTASSTQSCLAANPAEPAQRGFPWSAGGGTALACVFLFAIPGRRRRWRTLVGMVVLGVSLASGMLACTGPAGASCTGTTKPGTTPGSYTITVTGTSGSTTATQPVNLTVQ
jgi:hypothetical protein